MPSSPGSPCARRLGDVAAAKRADPPLGRRWLASAGGEGPLEEFEDLADGGAHVAFLAPALGSVPFFKKAMPPALVRGSGPVRARGVYTPTQWPHETPLPLTQVSGWYPDAQRRRRTLRPSSSHLHEATWPPGVPFSDEGSIIWQTSKSSDAASRPSTAVLLASEARGARRVQTAPSAGHSRSADIGRAPGTAPAGPGSRGRQPRNAKGFPLREHLPSWALRGSPSNSGRRGESPFGDEFPDGPRASDSSPERGDEDSASLRARTPSPREDGLFGLRKGKFSSTWGALGGSLMSSASLSSGLPGERPETAMCAQLINLTRSLSESKLLSEVDWVDPLARGFGIAEKPSKLKRSVSKARPFKRRPTVPEKELPVGRDRGKAVLDALYQLRHTATVDSFNAGRSEEGGENSSDDEDDEVDELPPWTSASRSGSKTSVRGSIQGSIRGSISGSGRSGSKRGSSIRVEDEKLTLLEHTLVDTEDTPEQLQETLNLIRAGKEMTTELKSSRHPSMLGAERAYKVIARKLEVLEPLAQAVAQFEDFSSRKEEILKLLEDGATAQEVGPKVMTFGELVEESVHEKPYGRPHQAPRLNWDKFVSTFKLPKEHAIFYQAEGLLERESEDWMDKVVETAMRVVENERRILDCDVTSPYSPASEVARQLFILADGMGLPPDHSKLVKTEMLANAQRCRRLLSYAKVEVIRIMGTTSVGELRKVAEELVGYIEEAVVWGVTRTHPDVAKALELAQTLRAESVRQFALKLMGARRQKIGEADKAAQEVEGELREAEKFGCPYEMKQMEEARKLGLQLREEEGLRKRQENSNQKARKSIFDPDAAMARASISEPPGSKRASLQVPA